MANSIDSLEYQGRGSLATVAAEKGSNSPTVNGGVLRCDDDRYYATETYAHLRPPGLESIDDDNDGFPALPSSPVALPKNQGSAVSTGNATQSERSNNVAQSAPQQNTAATKSAGPDGSSLHGRTVLRSQSKLAAAAGQAVLPGLGAGVVGAIVGAGIFAIIGSFIFPGLGTAAGAILGAKIGAAAGAGGATLGGFGGFLHGAYKSLARKEELTAAMHSPQARQPASARGDFDLPDPFLGSIDMYSFELNERLQSLASQDPSFDINVGPITEGDRKFVANTLTAIIKDVITGQVRSGPSQKNSFENRGSLSYEDVRKLVNQHGQEVLKSLVTMKAAAQGTLDIQASKQKAVRAARDLLKTMTAPQATERDIVRATTRAVIASRLYSLAAANDRGGKQAIGDREFQTDFEDILKEAKRSSWGVTDRAKKLLGRGHPVRALIMHGESLAYGMPEQSFSRVTYPLVGAALQTACRVLAGTKPQAVEQIISHIVVSERMMFDPEASPQTQKAKLQDQISTGQAGAKPETVRNRIEALDQQIQHVNRYRACRGMDRIAPAAAALFEESQQLTADLLAYDKYLDHNRGNEQFRADFDDSDVSASSVAATEDR